MQRSIFVILLASMYCSSCKHRQAEVDQGPQALCVSDSMAHMIRIDTASAATLEDELKLSGEISFNDAKVVKIFPFSSGQVLNVKVALGDKVSKGQVLATIKSADVAGNYADLSSAGNDVAIARKQMDNAASLYQDGIASEREYLEAKENYEKALTAARKVKEQININGGGSTSPDGIYVVRAPMSGYVVEKKITQGGFIRNDNNDNMFTIGDISDVWVWANVYETDISRVKEGYTARVTTLAYPDTSFAGTVDKVSEVLDPVTKVMKIRVRLPNPGRQLKPEMFANIIIENKQGKKAVTIPTTSVVSDNGHAFVIVYHDRCKLELREIKPMKTVGNNTYISQGIEVGERLLSQNQILFYNALKED